MAMQDLKKRLIRIVRERSFQYSDTPKFKLASGAESHFYFNMKMATQLPEGMHILGKIVFDRIRELGLSPDGIGGLTLGADPIAYAVAMHSYTEGMPINAFVIRKAPKDHGLKLPVEGDVSAGDHVIIIDDVITTGGSTIKAINVAQDNGLIVDTVIVLVDRCELHGRQNIEALGLQVHSILTVHDFVPSKP